MLSFPLPAASGRLRTQRALDPCASPVPDTSVGCKRLPGVRIDSQRLELTLAYVLEAHLGSPGGPLSCRQFSVERVLGDTALLTAGDWASQRRSLCFSVMYMEVVPALLICAFLDVLSLRVMPKTRLRKRMRKEFSLLSRVERRVHGWLP